MHVTSKGAAILCSALTAQAALAQPTDPAQPQSQTGPSDSTAAAVRADAAARDPFELEGQTPSVQLLGLIQFRYQYNFADSANSASNTTGFEVARTRLVAKGDFGESISYFVQGDFGSSDGVFDLLDAIVDFQLNDQWLLRVGQFRPDFQRELLIGAPFLQAIDRSPVNAVFNVDRVQGFMVQRKDEKTRFSIGFNDGSKSLNSAFTAASEADFAFTSRVEFKPLGEWSRFRESSGFIGQEKALMLGGAVHWQEGGSTNGTADNDQLALTADINLEGSGWNVFVAGNYRRTQGQDMPRLDDFGLVVSGGLFIEEQTELFARSSTIFADSSRMSPDVFQEATVGFNYYFVPQSHALTFTAELNYFNGDTFNSDIFPVNTKLNTTSSASDQFGARAQIEMKF